MITKFCPWKPAVYTLPDIVAIQALQNGTADEHQQKRALQWIIEVAAGTFEEQYSPDSERDTAYALGMRKVGQQIIKLTKLDTAKQKEFEEKKNTPIKSRAEKRLTESD